ncbi:C45 family autoproteolytic acyltransferase/hydolase [Amycolatopsis taiwanensis]|uniref:C45 family autoproteolytic acyltransferase/hydolase n=1 Tax=Amycolatopsis taiwanensis TaxID=342230 RepID=UPI0004B64C2F|nr:C45 family peptidase [Amycolatopsis taiwanensis]
MAATLTERTFGPMRWLVVEGARDDCFRALGRAARAEVHAVLAELPEVVKLQEYSATAGGRGAFERVVAASEANHPEAFRELTCLAEGAESGADDLLLANLRGDLAGFDGTGCSDVAHRGHRSLLGHNEDGAPVLAGRLILVTLLADGEIPVFFQWYPGFLPGNAHTVTGNGLVVGVDHLPPERPGPGGGRHFVARDLQRQPDLESAIRYLATTPSAGGFAYTIGDVETGRIVVVETVADGHVLHEVLPHERMTWHTNHARYLEPAASGSAESRVRGDVLAALAQEYGIDGPSPERLLEALGRTPVPSGVFRPVSAEDPLTTLCTTVVDLTGRTITLLPPGGEPATVDIDQLFTSAAAGI